MLCGGVAACHRYGVCVYTVRCVECMGWQHVIGMVCVLFAVLSATALNTANSIHTIPMTCCHPMHSTQRTIHIPYL